MIPLQKLPIGKSSFQRIRENNELYVDKTRHIHKMVDEGDYYFLSRPRRFGKSLTVSTLQCLFEGKKELFDGLWIAQNGQWKWQAHPVVVIDFNEIPRFTADVLRQGITLNLKQTAMNFDVTLSTDFIETQFQELIFGLKQKLGNGVVVLVDEYDKPIIDHLGKGEEALTVAMQNREILKSFFGVLKGAQVAPCLRFVFFTGVSKFSRVSIFSELNNLKDISMNEAYADALGYNPDEMETYFQPYVTRLAEAQGVSEAEMTAKLKHYYNGYRFSARDMKVYNPFSILCAVNEMKLKNYWFETGTPTFLVNLLKEKRWYLPQIEGMRATEAVFSSY